MGNDAGAKELGYSIMPGTGSRIGRVGSGHVRPGAPQISQQEEKLQQEVTEFTTRPHALSQIAIVDGKLKSRPPIAR